MAGKRLKRLVTAEARRMTLLSCAEEGGGPGAPEKDGGTWENPQARTCGALWRMATRGFTLERDARERAGNAKRDPS